MAGVEQQQNLRHAIEQTAVLSQQQQRGLELLAMPQLKLDDAIQQELTQNPLLEAVLPDIFDVVPEESSGSAPKSDDDDYEDGFEVQLARQEDWINDLPAATFSGEDHKLEFLNNLPAPKLTLRDILLAEADNADIPEKLQIPVFEVISSLDPNGFLTVPLADLIMSMPDDSEIDIDDIKAALELIRRLAPSEIWIGYRSDFFKQHLAEAGKLTPEFSRLCDELEHLPEGVNGVVLKKQLLPELAAKLDVPLDEVEKMLEVIQTIKVNHLQEFEPADSVAVYPDLEIVGLPDGSFAARVMYETERRVIVSPVYENMAQDKNLSPEDKALFDEFLPRARNFIHSLKMRESTLQRLGDLIADRQKDFFRHGISGLKSFSQSKAAELLGFNVSTVSRAVEDKYVRTPRGMFPLEFFFPGGAGSSASGDRSREAVMEDIRSIIDNENPALPLSDDRISEMLREEGVQISRRTVAKYREMLGIPGAFDRKKVRV